MKEHLRMAKATLDSSKRMLTIPQVCLRLTLGESTVRGLIKSGKLRAAKFGKWRIDPVDLEAYIESQKTASHAPTVAAAVEAAFDADTQFTVTEHRFL